MFKQPLAGIVATLVVMAVALGFISLFEFGTFTTWVAFLIQSSIPVQIAIAVMWGGATPGLASGAKQPLKGLAQIPVMAILGGAVAWFLFVTVGGSVAPPTPMPIQFTVEMVLTTFWLAIMFGGWPFTAIFRNKLVAGLAMVVASLAISYLIFLTYDYGFLKGAPIYVPRLDPHGPFNAWNAVVYYLCVMLVMFLMLSFDLWPLTKFPSIMKQPTLGVVWTLVCLVIGTPIFYIGVIAMKMDPVIFMVKVPVPVIFGTIVVLNMMQGSLYPKLTQPVKGVANAITVIVVGEGLAYVYGLMSPVVTKQLASGPPTYDFELWLASALLGVTFPFLVTYAECLKLWGLKKD